MQKKKCDFDGLMLISLLVGVCFGVVIGFSLLFFFNDSLVLKNVLYRWQTLAAGLIAFLASFLLLCSAVYQDLKNRKRKAFVAQAFLPHSLNSITSYLIDSAEFYSRYTKSREGIKSSNTPPPTFDDSCFSDFRVLAENENKKMAMVIAYLVADLQVLTARMKMFHDQTGRGEAVQIGVIHNELIGIGFLLNVVVRMYEYSRNKTIYDYSSVDHQEISREVFISKAYSSDRFSRELKSQVERRVRGLSPLTGYHISS